MPRVARKKSSESIYHIMARSISEIDLFQCDEDKYYYISLVKRYVEKFKCSVYSYCMMSNHMHLFIDPKGTDISLFMLSLNTAYVSYYNRKYKRIGHLFQGRFASILVDSDLYAMTLSAYIHNNSKDIEGYSGKEYTYQYSSYGFYLGIRNDEFDLIDKGFVLEHFSKDPEKAAKKYLEFVSMMKDTGIWNKVDKEIIEAYVGNEYKSQKTTIKRDNNPSVMLQRIVAALGNCKDSGDLKNKYSRQSSKFRAFVTYVLRILCGFSYKQICEFVGNISSSGVTNLTNIGFKLSYQDELYRKVFEVVQYS